MEPASPEPQAPRPVGAQRLTALADGVFAIAMTLLVLELAVPVVTEEGGGLGDLLLEMWPEFLMYARKKSKMSGPIASPAV